MKKWFAIFYDGLYQFAYRAESEKDAVSAYELYLDLSMHSGLDYTLIEAREVPDTKPATIIHAVAAVAWGM